MALSPNVMQQVPICWWCSLLSWAFTSPVILYFWAAHSHWFELCQILRLVEFDSIAMSEMSQFAIVSLSDNQSIVQDYVNSILNPYVHNATSLSFFSITTQSNIIHNQWCKSRKEWLLLQYTSLHEWNVLLIRNCVLMKIIFQTIFDEFIWLLSRHQLLPWVKCNIYKRYGQYWSELISWEGTSFYFTTTGQNY